MLIGTIGNTSFGKTIATLSQSDVKKILCFRTTLKPLLDPVKILVFLLESR